MTTTTGQHDMPRKRLHVFIESDLMDKVDRRAKRERRTKTEVIRQALLRYLVSTERGEEN
jgi:metal-responsive CopG/Arc/MetJ family transcriptional regulator